MAETEAKIEKKTGVVKFVKPDIWKGTDFQHFYEGQNGKTFDYYVEFTDGTKGVYTSKTEHTDIQTQTYFLQGQSVQYIKETRVVNKKDGGTFDKIKIKPDKPRPQGGDNFKTNTNFNNGNGNGNSNYENPEEIIEVVRSMCWGYAGKLVKRFTPEKQAEKIKTIDDIKALAFGFSKWAITPPAIEVAETYEIAKGFKISRNRAVRRCFAIESAINDMDIACFPVGDKKGIVSSADILRIAENNYLFQCNESKDMGCGVQLKPVVEKKEEVPPQTAPPDTDLPF